MSQLSDRIREILEMTPGLTQKGLAERMGLDPAAVNRMLHGRRNIMADEIPIIEEYLGVHLNLSAPIVPANIEYRQEPGRAGRRGFSDVPAQSLPPPEAQVVPVYGTVAGGALHLNRDSEAVDWALRHPAQFGIGNAFAVYVFSENMEPRYFQGELVYVHPGRPPEMNRDCVVDMKNGEAYILRFLRHTDGLTRVAQFNPPREFDIPKAEIKAIYAIIGRN